MTLPCMAEQKGKADTWFAGPIATIKLPVRASTATGCPPPRCSPRIRSDAVELVASLPVLSSTRRREECYGRPQVHAFRRRRV